MIKVKLIFNKDEYSQYLSKNKIAPFHPNDEYGYSSFKRLLSNIDFSKENIFIDKKVAQIIEEYESLWYMGSTQSLGNGNELLKKIKKIKNGASCVKLMENGAIVQKTGKDGKKYPISLLNLYAQYAAVVIANSRNGIYTNIEYLGQYTWSNIEFERFCFLHDLDEDILIYHEVYHFHLSIPVDGAYSGFMIENFPVGDTFEEVHVIDSYDRPDKGLQKGEDGRYSIYFYDLEQYLTWHWQDSIGELLEVAKERMKHREDYDREPIISSFEEYLSAHPVNRFLNDEDSDDNVWERFIDDIYDTDSFKCFYISMEDKYYRKFDDENYSAEFKELNRMISSQQESDQEVENIRVLKHKYRGIEVHNYMHHLHKGELSEKYPVFMVFDKNLKSGVIELSESGCIKFPTFFESIQDSIVDDYLEERDTSHEALIIIIQKQVMMNAEDFSEAVWAFKITGNILKMYDGDAIFKEFIEFTQKSYETGLIHGNKQA